MTGSPVLNAHNQAAACLPASFGGNSMPAVGVGIGCAVLGAGAAATAARSAAWTRIRMTLILSLSGGRRGAPGRGRSLHRLGAAILRRRAESRGQCLLDLGEEGEGLREVRIALRHDEQRGGARPDDGGLLVLRPLAVGPGDLEHGRVPVSRGVRAPSLG